MVLNELNILFNIQLPLFQTLTGNENQGQSIADNKIQVTRCCNVFHAACVLGKESHQKTYRFIGNLFLIL